MLGVVFDIIEVAVNEFIEFIIRYVQKLKAQKRDSTPTGKPRSGV
jgi:hypothetical protein